MTVKTSATPQQAVTHECCGGKAPIDVAGASVATHVKKQAAPSPAPKPAVPTKSKGSCCG
jgi:hypothetical protein